MSNPVRIIDGTGSGCAVQVDSNNRLRVAVDLDDEFKQDLKKLIYEIMNEIAEGHLLGTEAEKMTKDEMARKLAAITGKPIEGFFNEGHKKNANTENSDEKKVDRSIVKVEDNKKQPAIENKKEKSRTEEETRASEVAEYQKLFEGSRIVNDRILGGRQMTRKEYLKITKNMFSDEFYNHPLMYKMFRAEGQNEAVFPAFCKKFPEREIDENEEQE